MDICLFRAIIRKLNHTFKLGITKKLLKLHKANENKCRFSLPLKKLNIFSDQCNINKKIVEKDFLFLEELLKPNPISRGSQLLKQISFLASMEVYRDNGYSNNAYSKYYDLIKSRLYESNNKIISSSFNILLLLQIDLIKNKELYLHLLNNNHCCDLANLKNKITSINNSIFSMTDQINRIFFEKEILNVVYSDIDERIIHETFSFMHEFIDTAQISFILDHLNSKGHNVKNISEVLKNIEASVDAYNKILFHLSFKNRELIYEYIVYKNNFYNHKLLINQSEKITPKNYYKLELDGILRLGKVFSPKKLVEINKYFKNTFCYNSHVASYSDGVARKFNIANKFGRYGSFRNTDTLLCPHLLEFAISEKNTLIASNYLKSIPVLYSIHVWWTFNNEMPAQTHEYHRDQDDAKFLSLFIYLTDVLNENSGGIDFIKGSHLLNKTSDLLKSKLSLNYDPEIYFSNNLGNGYPSQHLNEYNSLPLKYSELFLGLEERLLGKAGNAFIGDTYALHRGSNPESKPRLACWIRYGLIRPPVYVLDNTKKIAYSEIQQRVVKNDINKYILRLLVDFER
jgi:hypothetical protein